MTRRITILHVASNGDHGRSQPPLENFLGIVLSTELKSAAVKKLLKANVSSVSP